MVPQFGHQVPHYGASNPDYPTVILPTLLLIGVAFGLGFAALSLAVITGVSALGALTAISGLLAGRPAPARRAGSRRGRPGGRRA